MNKSAAGTGQTPHRHLQLIVWLIAIGLATATLLIPAPSTIPVGIFRISLLLETCLAGLAAGSGILFLIGLSSFRQQLRLAYRLIALGMLVYALTQIQLPLLEINDLLASPYVTGGWLNMLYAVSSLLVLLGVLKYAKLLQIRSIILSPAVIALVIIAAVLITPLLPHKDGYYATQLALYINVGTTAVAATLFGFAATGLLLIKRAVGPAYINALAWSVLGVGMLAVAEITTGYAQLNAFTGFFVGSGLFFAPFIIATICNLRAAVAFNNIVSY